MLKPNLVIPEEKIYLKNNTSRNLKFNAKYVEGHSQDYHKQKLRSFLSYGPQ